MEINPLKLLAYIAPIVALTAIVWLAEDQITPNIEANASTILTNHNLSAEQIQPIPNNFVANEGIVAIGEKLFKDTRLSENKVSCNDCHNLRHSGTDGLKLSKNIEGGSDFMNTPSIFNATFNPLLTWYGRNETLDEQLEGVIKNTKHMGGNWDNIISRLKKDNNYRKKFNLYYKDGLTKNNIKHALVSYERTLITPNAPFDDYLRGDEYAINKNQKKGYELFKEYGCISCHQGVNIGGNLHAKLGTFTSPFKNKSYDTDKKKFNLGRYNLTKSKGDEHVFRVPSLRNVAVTAPYFHSGGISDLKKAVKFMAKYQTGRAISDGEASLITDFLHTLTGKYKGITLTSQFKAKVKK